MSRKTKQEPAKEVDPLLEPPSFPSMKAQQKKRKEQQKEQEQKSNIKLDQPTKQESQTVNTAQKEASQEDQYETYNIWRKKYWKQGITQLRVMVREVDGSEFIDKYEGPMEDMPDYWELLKRLGAGVFKVQILSPSRNSGYLSPVTKPLRIYIAPKGENEVTGMSSPWSARGNNNSPFDLKTFLEFQQRSEDKNTALQQNVFQQQNQNTNALLQAAFSNPKQGSDSTLIAAMMQQAQISQQQQAQQSQQTLMMMIQMMQTMSQTMVAAMQNKGDEGGQTALIEAMKSNNQQWSTLFTTFATTQGNMKEHLEIYKTISDIANDQSTIKDIADLASAMNIGEGISAITGATAKRIEAPANNNNNNNNLSVPPPLESLPGQPPPPQQLQQAPPSQAYQQQPPQQQHPQPPQQQQPNLQAEYQFFSDFLNIVHKAYEGGVAERDFVNVLKESNIKMLQILAYSQYSTDQIMNAVQNTASQLGCSSLATTGGQRFVLNFLKLVEEDTKNGQIPAPQ